MARYESSECRLKFKSVAGIHWDGDGARRRRFWPGGLGVDVDATLEVVVVEEQEALLVSVGGETTCAAARLPLLGAPDSWGGVEVDVEGDEVVDEEFAGGDPDDDLWDEEGEFTGFKMHRLTCLFKLDATPKRRPHVSHTKASNEQSEKK